ncbi:amidohydrolase [Gemmatimonadota bacterium]
MKKFLSIALLFGATACSGPGAADLVLVNGRVFTLDEQQPWAEAVAIQGERIIAVGSNGEVRGMAGSNTRTINLDGAFALPGFNDAHVHIDGTGALLTGANLLDVHVPDAFTERIAGAASRLPEGSWITRGDWGAYELWAMGSAGTLEGEAPQERFKPHRDLVDDVTPNHPVLVNRHDREVFLANSRALELAGIDARTSAPRGGTIERDASGRLTGILTGAAVDLVQRVIPPLPFDTRLANFMAVLDEARAGGVTTMQDLTRAPQVMVYREVQRRGDLTCRIQLRPMLDMVEHVAGLGISEGVGDDWIKFIGLKAWVDGIMGSSGAMFFEPYDHMPNNKGLVREIMKPEGRRGAALSMDVNDHYTDFPPGGFERLLEASIPTNVPPHVHAIGTLGNRILLDVYDKVLKEHDMVDSDHRWRVIHAQVVHPTDMPRFGELNLVAEINPYHVTDDMRWMEERIGTDRSEWAYAFRGLKDAGAVLIFGSDSPGTNAARYYLSPVYGLYAAVTRQTLEGEPAEGWFPGQRLTIEEAIEAYTKTPAWATFEEDIKGTLAPGMLADIAVFDTDLVDAGQNNPSNLLDAEVLYTIAGGRVVYEGTRE